MTKVEDTGIVTLLDLDGQVIDQGNGYVGSRLPYDHTHRHISDQGVPYEFRDAHQLLADFFAEVDRVLKEVEGS